MTNRVPQSQDELYQLSKEQLVEMIKALQEKIARLEESLNLDSRISSKPPSTDLIKKSEQKKLQLDADRTTTKRKPGGQPGHEGKTRKGFGRFDRIEILCPTESRNNMAHPLMDGLLLGWVSFVVSGCAMLLWNVVTPKVCSHCGGTHFATAPLNVEVQQVAQFVANPIEIVEYHRHYNQCTRCGTSCAADWSQEMIPGQDLGVRLQALIGWLGNYGHMPYAKIRELLLELGQIDIGEGTLVATNERVAQAIEPPVEALGNKIPTQSWATFIPQTN